MLFFCEFFATVTSRTVFNVARTRWEKVVNRKLNFAKSITGMVGRIFALFFGHTKIVNRDKHLNITNELYYREKTDGSIYGGCSVLEIAYNITANCFAYAVRYTANTFVTVADFTYASRQGDRVNCAYNTFGHIVADFGMTVAVTIVAY